MNYLAIVAKQAGTAAAFEPVIKKYCVAGFRVFAYPSAQKIFEQVGVQYVGIDKFEQALPYLKDNQVTQLLTGTSLSVIDDALWWEWARKNDVISVAFIDQWVNYAQRFIVRGQMIPSSSMPDIVAVVDDVAASRVIAEGVCPEKVIISGTPTVDRWCEGNDIKNKHSQFGLINILYVCEPNPEHWADSTKLLDLGFEERMAELSQAAMKLADDHRCQVLISVKPHPIQLEQGLNHVIPEKKGKVEFCITKEHSIPLALNADLVLGHRSVLLYESAYWGKRVVVMLEGGEEPPDFVNKHLPIKSCYVYELADVLLAFFRLNPARKPFVSGKATQFFVEKLGLDKRMGNK